MMNEELENDDESVEENKEELNGNSLIICSSFKH